MGMPRGCWLWKRPEVVEALREFDLDVAIFCGCAFDLVSAGGKNKGKPIKKPWVVMSDSPAIVQGFSGKGCPGPLVHIERAPAQGADTERIGYYTNKICL